MQEFLRRCTLNFRNHMEVLREYDRAAGEQARAA